MSIKKTILTATACLLAAASISNAQLGVKAGIGYGSMHGSSSFEQTYPDGIICPMVGITYHLTLGPIGVKPELMLVKEGGTGTSYDTITALQIDKNTKSINAWLLDAPLLGSLSILPTLSIIAGPSVSYYITGNYTHNGTESNIKTQSNPNAINIGGVVGLQFMMPVLKLGIDARYQRGFTNLLSSKVGSVPDNMVDLAAVTLTYLF